MQVCPKTRLKATLDVSHLFQGIHMYLFVYNSFYFYFFFSKLFLLYLFIVHSVIYLFIKLFYTIIQGFFLVFYLNYLWHNNLFVLIWFILKHNFCFVLHSHLFLPFCLISRVLHSFRVILLVLKLFNCLIILCIFL